MFSAATLNAVPTLYSEVTFGLDEDALPRILTGRRVGGVRVLEWLVVLLGIPLFYLATVFVDRLLRPAVAGLWKRLFKDSTLFARHVLPLPIRLLLVAGATRWLLSVLPLPLLVRQFGSNAASLLSIAAFVWLVFLINSELETNVIQRFPRASGAAAQSLLRVARRAVDMLVIFVGVLATLRHFGVDPTPALAGLGVGGIAVALAAQKTLENVIAGRVAHLRPGGAHRRLPRRSGRSQGTVDHIGLRSTRIRTLDRTIVSVPNSQIANISLETLSARDKFWFHPVVGLRYETTTDQLRAVLEGIRQLLAEPAAVDSESVRVRFLRLGASSLDVDGLRLRLRAATGRISSKSRRVALRHHRCRRPGRSRNRVSVADDVPVDGPRSRPPVAGKAGPREQLRRRLLFLIAWLEQGAVRSCRRAPGAG